MAKTILLIDDDFQFSQFMHELLSENGYDVILADNGVSGLTQYEKQKPDLIITDIVMPEKEGIEVILAVREIDTVIPIIAVSGGNFGNAGSYLKMADKFGVNAALVKPFKIDEILALLIKLLPN